MPGYDGTGPRGMGPMTGGGRGFCAVPMNNSWRSGMRAGYGRGGGRGMRNRFYATGLYGWQRDSYVPGSEKEELKNVAEALKKELSDVQSRIQELEKSQDDK